MRGFARITFSNAPPPPSRLAYRHPRAAFVIPAQSQTKTGLAQRRKGQTFRQARLSGACHAGALTSPLTPRETRWRGKPNPET